MQDSNEAHQRTHLPKRNLTSSSETRTMGQSAIPETSKLTVKNEREKRKDTIRIRIMCQSQQDDNNRGLEGA